MKYISGIHALNLNCSLKTCGDWHQSWLQWKNVPLLESNYSIFGDYGIEFDQCIPEHIQKFNVANHIRALLDLLEQNKLSVAQGIRDDFICNDNYTLEIFNKVILLKNKCNWHEIDRFMGKEYFSQWLEFKKSEY